MSKASKATVIKHEDQSSGDKPKTVILKSGGRDGELPAKISPDQMKEHILGNIPTVFKNYKYPGANEAFPAMPIMRTCDKHYPLALVGPLFVDEPKNKQDEEACKIKREVMKKNGVKYLVITKSTDLYDAMEQLGITK